MSNNSLNKINRIANNLYREGTELRTMEQAQSFLHNNEQFQGMMVGSESACLPIPSSMQIGEEKFGSYAFPNQIDDCGYYFLTDSQLSSPIQPVSDLYENPCLDAYSIKKDFPIFQRRINGKPLIWLDNAATTQKPLCVINALSGYYNEYNSNVHRGAHTLAKLATDAFETARRNVKDFLGASSVEEIVFVRGTTEAINLVAESFGGTKLREGDEILLTLMEHHSNIVPWQKLQKEKGAIIKVAPVNERGEIILEEYEKMLTPRTKIAAISHVSNVLGTVNPVREMIDIAHRHGTYVLIDGAQSVPHLGINVKELDADFYVFSGHKLYGPTGIGVLYGKKALLEEMPPWQRGGGMIKNVSFEETTFNNLPDKFEAGTGNIADAIGLGAAIDYLQKVGMTRIERYEKQLTEYAMEKLQSIPGLHLIGTAPNKTSVISFVIDGITPDNVAQGLNQNGIAVRVGHHCAQPILRRYGLSSSVRASLGMYNTTNDIDCLVGSVFDILKY
jgi:cysteine desulfurase/selenocysteine lyase